MSIARPLVKLQAFQAVSAEIMSYGNEATTGTNVKAALDWIFAALYPNTQDSVATYADLPAAGNTLNDYRVVLDDGDGKAAGYRWEQREGEASPSWHKIHDMDWSSDSILTSLQDIAQELYVHKNGRQDLDASGNPITGLYEGQTIYGGATSGNLTLNANAGDGTDPQSGFIQLDGDTRPTSDDSYDLGTVALRFRDLLLSGYLDDGTDQVTVAEAKAAFDHSQVTDDSNPHATSYDSLASKLGTLTVDGDATGSVDLSSSGDQTLTLEVQDDSHNHTASTISDFDTATYAKMVEVLQNTDQVTWNVDGILETIAPAIEVTTDAITNLSGPAANQILTGSTDGSEWEATSPTITLSGQASGSASFSSTDGGWEIDVSGIATDLTGLTDVDLTNKTYTGAAGNPTTITANAHGLQTGETVRLYGDLTGVYTVTTVDPNSFTIPTTTAAPTSGHYIPQGGQLLFDTTSETWKVAKEYEELRLSELQGLSEDILTQYVAKDGRSGGQTIRGGISASQNLTLESTAHSTKGSVTTKDNLTPDSDASYSGSWGGTNLGSPNKRWNDLHLAGVVKGLRPEEVGTLPAVSGTELGRMVFFDGQIYFNNGTEYGLMGGGGGEKAITTVSSHYSATEDDGVIMVNGTYTVTLPDATTLSTASIPRYTIKNIGTGSVTIDGFSTQTIDGSLTVTIENQYAALTVVSNGTNWFII